MSDRRGFKRKRPHFVMLRYDMMESQAWRSLSAPAQALWLHIRRRYNGNNNGEIPLSCREAGKLLHVAKNTAGRYFNELQDKGFIKIGQHSSFTCKMRLARGWVMTDLPYDNKGPSNEWRNWKKDTPKNLKHGSILDTDGTDTDTIHFF